MKRLPAFATLLVASPALAHHDGHMVMATPFDSLPAFAALVLAGVAAQRLRVSRVLARRVLTRTG